MLVSLLLNSLAQASILDEAETPDPLLLQLASALEAYNIDVIHNLNHRQLARGRINTYRLGRFPDLPNHSYPTSPELQNWEAELKTGLIQGLVIFTDAGADSFEERALLQDWLDDHSIARTLVSFAATDREAADSIASVARGYGHAVLFLDSNTDIAVAGNFYATAARRFAIDGRSARRLESEVTELTLLGERVRRNSNSIFRSGEALGGRAVARTEPSVFEKESLGDEFSESTIREIIVPGGVALGETAYLKMDVSEVRFTDGQFLLLDEAGVVWELPALEAKASKALWDFVARSIAIKSNALVDIDEEGRVRISSALRDTDAGFEIMHADTLPFAYVQNLDVIKSVIIDTGVDWLQREGNRLDFVSNYEVRFLSADNMRVAQTRVALEFEYGHGAENMEFQRSWGRDSRRLRENLDYAGLGKEMTPVAKYAGWIGLFRSLQEQQISFLRGRYELLKVDKRGQETPARH
jgi:hypothetical protein